jgi:hypothetical protein
MQQISLLIGTAPGGDADTPSRHRPVGQRLIFRHWPASEHVGSTCEKWSRVTFRAPFGDSSSHSEPTPLDARCAVLARDRALVHASAPGRPSPGPAASRVPQSTPTGGGGRPPTGRAAREVESMPPTSPAVLSPPPAEATTGRLTRRHTTADAHRSRSRSDQLTGAPVPCPRGGSPGRSSFG